MLASMQNIIPVVTSEAGLCLTAENWREAKVTVLAYSLEFLLHKPGIELLKKISNLSAYLRWSGSVVLNTASLVANQEGNFLLKSPYDGSKIKLTSLELIELVSHLQPGAVILPRNTLQNCPKIWEIWIDSITPFLHPDDLKYQNVSRAHGVYLHCSAEADLAQIDCFSHLSRYVIVNTDEKLLERVRAKGIEFIETNVPADEALAGRVYSQEGGIDLTNNVTKMQFEPIDPSCTCPVCMQKFTKAYFHHLLQHTPLLCNRFLIQHNVFWMGNNFKLI